VASITTVRTRSGDIYEQHIEFPLGAAQNPLSETDLREKFVRLTHDVVAVDRAERIMNTIMALDEVSDISDLTGLMSALA
jgi:2-methylcitrate dehydratase PrpD